MKALAVIACLAAAGIAGCANPQVADPTARRIDAPATRAGERWVYDEINPYKREVVGTFEETAAGASARQEFLAPYLKLPYPLAPGAHWNERIAAVDASGGVYTWLIHSSANGWERVRTPAGEFDALRISRTMNLGDADGDWHNTTRVETLWYAPAVNRWVRIEQRSKQRQIARVPQTREDWRVWVLREHQAG